MSDCCTGTNSNFGVKCAVKLAPIEGVYFQQKYDATGGRNQINLKTVDYTAFQNLLIADEDTRLYPLGELTNAELPIEDSKFETAKNGKMQFLTDGTRTLSAELWAKISTWITAKKLTDKRCGDWQVYLVSKTNQFVGAWDGVDQFFGIPVDEESLDAKFMFATPDAGQKNMFKVNFERNFDESTMYVIDGNDLWDITNSRVAKFDFLNPSTAVIDCTLVSAMSILTELFVNINTDYISGVQNNDKVGYGNVQGLTIADFDINNLTTNLPVTILTCVEVDPGRYKLTFAAITSGNLLNVVLVLGSGGAYTFNGNINQLAP